MNGNTRNLKVNSDLYYTSKYNRQADIHNNDKLDIPLTDIA